MVIQRRFYAGMLAVLLLLPVSCSHKTVYVPDPSRQLKIAQGLPVAGPWSAVDNGLRWRILLGRDVASETDIIAAGLQLENVSSQPIDLSSWGLTPFSAQQAQWRIGGQGMSVEAAQPAALPTASAVQLAPGQPFVTDLVTLLIPPGAGLRQIDAQLRTANRVLEAPAVPVNVNSAEWGDSVDGARLRLASARSTYAAGEPLVLRAFIANTGGSVLVLHPPDWSTLDIETPRQRLLMQVKTADGSYAEVPSGKLWHGAIPGLPLLAPGTYKLRLEIDAPELPVPNRLAWHGKLVSNELMIEVVAN